MKAERFWPAVRGHIWDRIRSEFGLYDLEKMEEHFGPLHDDPETMMRQIVRVFVGDDTLCPGFQLLDGQLDPRVLSLFTAAMELQVPHNIFAAWMVSPLRSLDGRRPVDSLDQGRLLEQEMAAFADQWRPYPVKC